MNDKNSLLERSTTIENENCFSNENCSIITESTLDFNFTNSGLHVVCLNIHHILPKIDEIKYVLYNSDIHILGLIETFLNAEILDSDIQIPNYNIIRRDRNNRKGGGTTGFYN